MKRYAATLILGVALGAVGYLGWVAPTVSEIFMNVSDDRCVTFDTGEPDRNDPDCHNGMWDGRNYVEEWDRAHPSPSQEGWWEW